MQIILYDFKKKANSTARPETGGTTFECILKQDCSIVEPSIRINRGQVTTYTEFTYAYIPAFGRYYFITDMRNSGPVWEYDLRVDVLATFKVDIGNASLYVLRSSAAFNGDVIDKFYPGKSSVQTVEQLINGPLFHAETTEYININQGMFILGVINSSETAKRMGSISYYAMDEEAVANLCHVLLLDSTLTSNGFNFDTVKNALYKSFVDPLEYIKTCIWIPLPISRLSEIENVTSLMVWDWSIDLGSGICKPLDLPRPYTRLSFNVPIQAHPQAASRGKYLNAAPYTRMHLTSPGFGTFELPAEDLIDTEALQLDCTIDYITGAAYLYVRSNYKLLMRVSGNVGIEIQLAQVGYKGILSGALGVGAGVARVAAGDVSGAFGAIGSVVEGVTPSQSSTGSMGSFADLDWQTKLVYEFVLLVDEDNARNGRPLCEIRQLSTIPGFIQVQKGTIAVAATEGERDEIAELLEGGFFYE